MDPFLLNVIITILAISGVFASLLGFSGMGLVFVALLIYAFHVGLSEVGIFSIIIVTFITIISFFIDNIAVAIGAKNRGATKNGIWGAVIGGVLGLFILPPFGILVGSFIGSVIGEFTFNPNFRKSLEAGIGTFLGYVVGIFIKFLITLIAFIWLMVLVW